MNIAIGETIANIRKEKSLTQEQLSEIFGVSIAAVSKWETGVTYPDIELLPKIAEFFDISVDRLLGYDMSKLEMNLDECLKKADDLLSNNQRKEAIPYLANLAYKYPNNIKILVKYAEAKFRSVCGNPQTETHKKLFKEAEEILLSIKINGITRHDYNLVMNALYLLYLWDKKFDKAEKILNEFNSDGHDVWFYIHKGDMEKAKEKYYYLLEKTLLDNALIHGYYHIFYDNPEKIIDLNNKFIKVMEIFAKELPNNKISGMFEVNAFMYARLGKKDKSIAALEKYIEGYDDSYESFMDLINCDERKEYELIRNTDEFKKLVEKLK